MRKIFIALGFTFVCLKITAQDNTPKPDTLKVAQNVLSAANERAKKYLPNYAPLPPNASSFQKFGEYEVNLATGIPDISIALYTIQSGGISLPLTLRYHAGGFKVNDLSSWVGWGWSLDYGVAMSRSVQGLPDNPNGYLNSVNFVKASRNFCSDANDYTYATFLSNGAEDAEPDIFSYAIPSKSGKFILGQDSPTSTPQPTFLIPYQPIQIPRPLFDSNGHPTKIELVDDDGTKYVFGTQNNKEQTNITDDRGIRAYYNNFLCSTIQSPNTTDSIHFVYQNGGVQTIQDWQYSASMIYNEIGNYYNNSLIINPSTPNLMITTYTQKNPHKITFDNGEVEFVQVGSRSDLANSFVLNRILIKNKENDTLKVIRSIDFAYSYFKNKDSLNARLKLDRIQIKGSDGEVIQTYRLGYWTNGFSWNDSEGEYKKKDFFGFYNGQNNAHTITVGTHRGVPVVGGAANRLTVATYMKEGVLKQITYPTGGYTVFDYETNQYKYNDTVYLAGGLRVKNIKSYDKNNQVAFVKRYEYGSEDGDGIGKISYINWSPKTNIIESFLSYYSNDSLTQTSTATQASLVQRDFGDGSFDTTPVYYTQVKEFLDDSTQANGRNEYHFSYAPDEVAFINGLYSIKRIEAWKRGLLLEKKTFDANNQLVAHQQNTYNDFKTDTRLAAASISSRSIYEGTYVRNYVACSTGFIQAGALGLYDEYEYVAYSFNTGSRRVSTVINVLDGVIQEESYTYTDRLYPKTIERQDSQSNQKSIKELIYPNDSSYDTDSEVLEMRSRNMVGLALETIEKEDLNGTINTLFKQKTVYERFTGNNARGLTNNPLPKEIWVAPTGGTLEKRVEYTAYDTDGNPTEYKVDGISTALIWGYNKNLLLAQIQNATISAVNTALSTAGITAETYSVSNLSNTQLTALATFRNALPNSLVTWYSYRPHIGLSSSIAPNGLRSRFFYDVFGRLSLTRDHENNKLTEYEYLYGSINRITTKTYFTTTHAYFDGLGRPIQTIGETLSPKAKDIVLSTQIYDRYGRVVNTFPIAPTDTNTGAYVSNVLSLAQRFYKDQAPFTQTLFDSSPLNRSRQIFGLGYAWQSADKKTQLFDESAGASIRYYTTDANGNITLNGFYPANSLFKKRTIDEQGNTRDKRQTRAISTTSATSRQ